MLFRSRENFQHLDPLAQIVSELQTVSGLAEIVDELQTVSGLAPITDDLQAVSELAQSVDELQAVSELAPYVQAILDSRIVEMGSNANGEYVRWENGLQICWHVATMVRDDDSNYPSRLRYDWTFPASFADGVTAVGGSVNNATANWAVNASAERRLAGPIIPDTIFADRTFFVSWRIDGANWSEGQAVQNCQFWAIGRWK